MANELRYIRDLLQIKHTLSEKLKLLFPWK